MARRYRDNECVYKKGRIRFAGGWERCLLHDIDEEELLMDLLRERVRLDRRVGKVHVFREIDGYKLRFTQTQSRSRLIHVEKA